MSKGLSEHTVTVLLIDDQPLIGEALKRILASEADIAFHYCNDPSRALEIAGDVGPTIILQDLVLPNVDGLDMVKAYREDDRTRDVPVIVLSTREEPKTKADAFALGANDYIVKLPDRLELIARIRHHSRGYINQLQRDEAYKALAASKEALAREVDEAARYVTSLLPKPLSEGSVRADWRFIPSAALGGDTFGYHWIDQDYFAVYLIDVVGHGVGAALLSVSVLNAIRTESLPNTDFRDPGQVLDALNTSFEMAQQGDKYFTAWYGVYQVSSRTIRYSGGGHPPSILIDQVTKETVQLEATGPMVGAFEGLDFESKIYQLERPAHLFVYSDGVFEITQNDGTMWPFRDFVQHLAKSDSDHGDLDQFVDSIRALAGQEGFEDDFSITRIQFDP